jgi:flagellar biogenesis protein FliO
VGRVGPVGNDVINRSQQLGLVLLLVAFAVYVLLRVW